MIVFQFTAQESKWLDFALNMVAQLAAAGYHHFVALAGREKDCEAMHAGWRRLGQAPDLDPRLVGFVPACVWSSAPVFTDGNSLWVARYALLTSLVEQRINALLVDLDFVFHRDVYADLYSPCLIPATVLVHAEGGGPNGGFFRVRGAHPDGAAHWILAQVKRRYDMYKAEQEKTGTWPGAVMDQEIIKDAVRVRRVVRSARGISLPLTPCARWPPTPPRAASGTWAAACWGGAGATTPSGRSTPRTSPRPASRSRMWTCPTWAPVTGRRGGT